MAQLPNHIKKASRNEIEEIILSLKHLDLNHVELHQIKELLKPLFTGYAITTPIIPKGNKFYRGVPCDKKPQNVSQITYPEQNIIKTFQRANRPGEPLFYCCTSRNVPLFELNLNPADCVAISRWRTEEEMIVNNVGYTHTIFGNIGSDRPCPTWGKDDHPIIRTEENRLVTQFLSEEFTKVVPRGEEFRYKLSVAIAEKHIDGEIIAQNGENLTFAGLLYPTIAMKANADNLAVKTNFVDNHFELEQVEYIKLDDHPAEYEYRVTVLDFANTFGTDGNIEWKGRMPHWQLREKGKVLIFTVENGKWVARNSAGEIVDPN